MEPQDSKTSSGRPPRDADGALPPGAPGTGELGSFRAGDGVELRYRKTGGTAARAAVLYMHGIESHGAWFLPAAWRLAARGIAVYLPDRRGSGLNRDARFEGGATAGKLLADIEDFRAHLGNPPLHLLGLSWGGKLATAAAIERPGKVESLILLAPGLVPRVALPLRHRLLLLWSRLAGRRSDIPVPIEPEWFTTNPVFLDFIRSDPWRKRTVGSDFLFATLDLDRRIRRGLHLLRAPVHLVLAERDRIIDNDAVERLLDTLPAGPASCRVYPEAAHSIQFDHLDRLEADLAEFILPGCGIP